MQPSSLSRAALGLLVACAGVPGLAAQEAVTIQLAGRSRAVVRTVSSARGTMVFHEINEAGQPIGDSVVGELTSSAGISQQLLQQQGGVFVLGLRYDSLKTRARLVGQAWQESTMSGTGQPPLRVTLDRRLRIAAGATGPLPDDPVASGGLVSWRGVELPDRPVAPGDEWAVNAVFRLPPQLGALLDITVRDSLAATATAKLDSIVTRGADTLMYITVQQSLAPATLPATDAGDSARIELVGSQAASLLWSTGWGAYVSGASRARVVGRMHSVSAAGTPRLSQISWTLSTRMQVRN